MAVILNIGLIHYLILALFLFLTGLIGVLISRNMLRTVMSLFIMTIAIVLNFLTFGHYCDKTMENANIICIFVLTISVVQTIIALVLTILTSFT